MKKFQEKNPSNASIILKYTKNPSVTFKYPYKESIEKVVRKTVFSVWILFNLLFLGVPLVILLLWHNFSTSASSIEFGKSCLIFLFAVGYAIIPPLILPKILIKSDRFLSKMP